MASVPVGTIQTPPAAETTEERFRRLTVDWRAATGHLSSSTAIIAHPAFQEIIRMSRPVVPLMLRDLESKPMLWVWTLPDITGADPAPAADRGNIAKMTEAWLRWGRENGYSW